MSVPGSNLLRRAQRKIKFQSIDYYATNGRTLNSARQWVASFAEKKPLKASVQAVNRNSYREMGLDFNSFFVNVFASLDIVDVQRDSSGDRFIFNGDLYKMSNGQSWFSQDGWATCLAVRIASGVTSPNDVIGKTTPGSTAP